MNLRRKKPRPLTREERTYKDDRLFIIATEDTYAPNQYFCLFQNPRIKVIVLPTEAGLSAPEHVLKRLDDFVAEFDLMEEDVRCLLLDTDHWTDAGHVANFDQVCGEATQKGYELAHSNPCFEVWLLLHLVELDAAEQFGNCAEVVARIKAVAGEYSKKTIDEQHFPPESVYEAVERAKKLDASPNDRWPQVTGTHVYKVVQMLLP